jgi:glutamine synthetase
MSGRLDRVRHIITEHQIDTVECGLADLHGQLRGKRLTADHFLAVAENGFRMGDGIFSFDHASAVIETTFTSAAGGYPDMRARPLLDTFRPIPWRPGAAAVLCEALTERERTPLPICPRQALRRIVDEAARDGHDFRAALELEFYLLHADGTPCRAGGCYALGADAAIEPVLRDIRQDLSAFGIAVEASHVEFGMGQVEINVHPAAALTAADDAVYLKAVVKEIALRHGLRATFMARPWSDQPGSGMHLHLSRISEQSTQREHCLAGLLEHLPALVFLSTTTVNGYKRLVEQSFAPTTATWGRDNRTAAVRLPGPDKEQRLEYRGGAADANPYLLLAGCLAAGLDGLRRRLKPPARADGDAHALGPPLPRSLSEGMAGFEVDAVLREALGPALAMHLREMARREWRLFLAAITDWERERYQEHA